MALAQKRNPGCIITYGKEKTFFKKVMKIDQLRHFGMSVNSYAKI